MKAIRGGAALALALAMALPAGVDAAGSRLEFEQLGDTLLVTVAKGNYAAYRGATFAKTCCGTCP